MTMKTKFAVLLLSLIGVGPVTAEIAPTDSFNAFVKHMTKQHRFNETELRSLFKAVNIQQPILDAMSKPAEGKPWFQYREIFMTEARIAGGVQFWKDNAATLQAVERQYGVPAEIIVAIIGVETKYGAHTGKYRVIDALATLGFAYPPRSEFFLKELEQFLVLAREEHMDPLQPMGSYAGAMGFPQFMPSSFRGFAKDFDGDGKRDIWSNPADAIASVANYFVRNQWQPGAPVAYPVSAKGESYRQALSKGVKPDIGVAELRQLQVELPPQLAGTEKVKLLSYQQQAGEDLWLGLHNFYVITRYNHSPLYAMAVYQLSQAIAARKT
ncbi:lytic murein transglycosylase B [Methylomonas sp. SURF-1]|uniref:Lytic murein transglycosylase B n=1 Tax=Methylomonas aurea TaxID=2952224 RepID=A0ABT1UFI6_9GAMM|nr:lytic murein transglycosylase B [Methylomonas sp. SURF-1]MCQ8180791.1 lytic murein transglycosylase B [Methylomonas sp. SURF-1]